MSHIKKLCCLQLLVLVLGLFTINSSATTCYVDVNSTNPVPPYTSWSTAAADIQDAIDVSTTGGTVLVAPGVYTETITFYGKAILVTSLSGPSNTLLNPPAGSSAVTFDSGETSNSVICGFAITNGGIYASDDSGVSTSPTIVSNILLNCGIDCNYSSSPIIINNIISGSSSSGIYVFFGSPFIQGNIIENNAGGIGMNGASPIIINNLIENNQGDAIGMINASDPNIIQNIIINNTGNGVSAGVPAQARGPWIINNTFWGNGGSAVSVGGFSASSQVINNIAIGSPAADISPNNGVGNPPWYGAGQPLMLNNDFYSTNGVVYGGSVTNFIGTNGNISADPQFISPATGNSLLQPNSPCVDAGANAYVMTITDFGGGPRIIGSNVDMGAYEFQPSNFLAPEIEPSSQTVPVGQTATFDVTVVSPDALSYQWLFDGTNISGADNSNYTISDVQSNNAGVYSVIISNTFTAEYLTSSNAVLTVIPPVIVVQPAYLSVVPGSTAIFSVNATGYCAVGFQWQFDGTNIPGATNCTLVLTNANSNESGTYSVSVSSSLYGPVTSTNLTLSVSPIFAWGDPSFGETTVPTILTNVVMISASYNDGFALTASGTVVGWGSDGEVVPAGLSNVVEIAAGGNHCLALQNNGTVVAWGSDSYGQTSIPAGLSNVVALAGGGWHSLALESDGTVAAWGWNLSGQTTVPTGLSNVVALAAGGAHSLALLSDGTVVGWGYDHDGEINIPSGLSNVVAIAAGYYFSMALQANGTVVAWGDNSYGETDIPTGLSNVVAIAAGGYHCLALRADGSMVAWGDDSGGQNDIPLGLTNVVMMASGGYFNLALTGYGPPSVIVPSVQLTILGGQSVFVPGIGLGLNPIYFQWQLNGTNLPAENSSLLALTGTQAMSGAYSLIVSNSLGACSSSNVWLSVIPLLITNSPTNQIALAGTDVVLSVSPFGSMPFSYQWQFEGMDLANATNTALTISNIQPSQAGNYAVAVSNAYGVVTTSNAYLQVIPLIITSQPKSQSTFIGGSASFGVGAALQGPFAYQWELNGVPIAGATNNPFVLTNVAMAQAGIYSVVVQNGIGSVTSSNAVLTVSQSDGWGENNFGQAGLSSGVTNVVAISAGGYHNLALTVGGTVIAWGLNSSGQANVPAGLSNISAIAAGGYHSMALAQSGTVVAWGLNNYGQTNVPVGLSNVLAIAAGFYHSLALMSNGMVIAWGDNVYGQAAVPVGLSNIVAISAGGFHNLALKEDGTVIAWGLDEYGETNVPPGLSNVVAISAGMYHSLALKNNGTVVAWGLNVYGEANVPAGLTNVVAVAAGGFHSLALGGDGTVIAWGNNAYGQTSVPAALQDVEAISAGEYHSLALVNEGWPHIMEQPISRTVEAGANVTLGVAAIGTPILHFQWQFNGTNMVTATNSWLTLTNVSVTSSGEYVCVVTNAIGATLSSGATLTVLRTTPYFVNDFQFINGVFGLQLNGVSGHGAVIIYASTNLADWIPIFTNPPTVGELQFLDSSSTNLPYRFYKAAEQ